MTRSFPWPNRGSGPAQLVVVAVTLVGTAVGGCTQSAGRPETGGNGTQATGGKGGAAGGAPGSGGLGGGGSGGPATGGGGESSSGGQSFGGQGSGGHPPGGSSAMGGTPAGGKGGASATAGKSGSTGGSAGGSGLGGAGGVPHASGGFGGSPTISSCPILPSNHLFNTPIDTLPVDPRSAQYLATIGAHKLHMDFGMSTNIAMPDEYYGIPFNVIHGSTASWVGVRYASADPDLDWDPREESDCVDSASGAAHTKISPCTMAAAPNPVFPIPAMPLVEGGIDTNPSQPYGDHHILLIDVDACQLYELYHAYPRTGGSGMWDIFGSVRFDLRSNTLRPDGWTSSDAAGFPIFPLLLRADEASKGTISHALRFTITSSKIRNAATWPARHFTTNGTTSTNLPPMGQAFRLKASYQIPANFSIQSRAIAQAMKTYGIYIADGGSDMYIQGEPNTAWSDTVFSQIQTISSTDFEAVDLTPIRQRPGFDQNSGAVPSP